MLFAVFMGAERGLSNAPRPLAASVKFISQITLHIYVVQFLIIYALEKLLFPLNLIAVTASILAAASALYLTERCVRRGVAVVMGKTRAKDSKK